MPQTFSSIKFSVDFMPLPVYIRRVSGVSQRFELQFIKRFFLYDVLDRDLAKQASVAPFNGSVGNNTKMILFYTTYFEHMPWPDFGYSMSGLVNFTDLQGNVCPIQEFKCSISYIHLDFNRSARWCFMDHGCLHYEG